MNRRNGRPKDHKHLFSLFPGKPTALPGKRPQAAENKKSKTLVTVICSVSAFIVLAGGICFIVFYVKKRRKNGEKEKSVKESSSQK